jgi:hypothetical protein
VPSESGTIENEHPTGACFIPSIADLFFVMVFFILFFTGKSDLLGDGDTGYHIRAGEYILKTLSIPKFDIFSQHTPPIPWTAHEWLSEVIMAVIHSFFGLTGVIAFFAFLLALTYYLLFRILRSYRTDILLCIVVTALALSSSKIHWLARPHLFSFVLMIIYHYLLETWHCGKVNRLYLLPLIMLLWVNLHGGFLGGFILLGAYLVGSLADLLSAPPAERPTCLRSLRQLGLTIVSCLAVCLINPYGYRILLFPFKLVSDRFIMDHVSEFLSPDFHQWMPFKYLLLLMVAIFAVSRKTIQARELVLVLIFTNMALYSARYIPLFALITAPILTRKADESGMLIGGRVAEFFRKRSHNIERIESRATGYFWPALALIIVAAAVQSGRFPHGFDEKVKAVAACEFLMREKITGNMFNNDEFGDYLIYRGYPSYKVFFDGRSDMYGADLMKEYSKIANFEAGWEALLDKHRITWIFFDSDSRLSRYLLKDSNWALVYSDKVADIFVRNLPQYRQLIDKSRLVKQVVF